MNQINQQGKQGDSAGYNPAGEPLARVRKGQARTAVELNLLGQGRDLLLLVTGGQAHTGAVAVARPDTGNEPDTRFDKLITVPGHKEGPLAEHCARQLAQASGKVCVAVVGIHQDQATRQEIEDIVVHVKDGLQLLVHGIDTGEFADD